MLNGRNGLVSNRVTLKKSYTTLLSRTVGTVFWIKDLKYRSGIENGMGGYFKQPNDPCSLKWVITKITNDSVYAVGSENWRWEYSNGQSADAFLTQLRASNTIWLNGAVGVFQAHRIKDSFYGDNYSSGVTNGYWGDDVGTDSNGKTGVLWYHTPGQGGQYMSTVGGTQQVYFTIELDGNVAFENNQVF